MDIVQLIIDFGIDTFIIALLTVILTGLLKIPIKKLAQKTKISKKITRSITFLPIIIGFGLTVLNVYLFTKAVIFNKDFYVQWLSAVSLSLAIYAFWEKFVPSEKKILTDAEVKANYAAIKSIKAKVDNNKAFLTDGTAVQADPEQIQNSKKIVLTNNKSKN